MITVYTCDIIGSREYPKGERRAISRSIEAAFRESCALFPALKADYLSYSVTQGDEFQFNAARRKDFYRFLLYFRTSVALSGIKPDVMFRCGIGFGDKSIEGKTSYQMDGSAFSNSRSALEALKHKGNLNRLTRLKLPSGKSELLLNSILMFCDELESGWTLAQRRAVNLMLAGHKVTTAAEQLETSWQNLSKTLIAASWNNVEAAIKALENHFSR